MVTKIKDGISSLCKWTISLAQIPLHLPCFLFLSLRLWCLLFRWDAACKSGVEVEHCHKTKFSATCFTRGCLCSLKPAPELHNVMPLINLLLRVQDNALISSLSSRLRRMSLTLYPWGTLVELLSTSPLWESLKGCPLNCRMMNWMPCILNGQKETQAEGCNVWQWLRRASFGKEW